MSVIVINGIDGEVVLEAGEERQHRLDVVIEEEIGGRGGMCVIGVHGRQGPVEFVLQGNVDIAAVDSDVRGGRWTECRTAYPIYVTPVGWSILQGPQKVHRP